MTGLLSKIIKFNTIVVVGVFKQEQATQYHYITVKKQNNSLGIIASGSYESMDALIKEVGTKLPVILLADGKNILNKKIENTSEADINWKKSLDLATIYYTQLTYDDTSFMSFCRRAVIDDILAEAVKYKLQIVGLYAGGLTAALFSNEINDEVALSNDSLLQFHEGKLISVHKTPVAQDNLYTIQGSRLTNWQLPLYGAALQYFINSDKFSCNTGAISNSEEILYKKAFEYFGIGMLVTFFMLLLASYTAIGYYSGKNSELNQKTVFSSQSAIRIKALQEQKDQKLRILSETGQLSKSFLSYYAYTILESVPRSITLTSLDIFPPAGEIKDKSRVQLSPNVIYIKGTTSDDFSFNNWLEFLKQVKWISKFEIVSLKKDSKNIQRFELKVITDDV